MLWLIYNNKLTETVQLHTRLAINGELWLEFKP